MKLLSIRSLVFIAMATWCNQAAAQTPTVAWSEALPVAGIYGPAHVIYNGSGYLVAGTCGANGKDLSKTRLFALQTNQSGQVLWNTTYPTACKSPDCLVEVAGIVPSRADCFVLVGSYKYSTHTDSHDNAWLMKMDSYGRRYWYMQFGTAEAGLENNYHASSARYLPDRSLLVSGQKGIKAWMCCVDANGQVKWSKTYDAEKIVSMELGSQYQVRAAALSYNTTRCSINVLRISTLDGSLDTVEGVIECPAKNFYDPVVTVTNDFNVVYSIFNANSGDCTISQFNRDTLLQWNRLLNNGEESRPYTRVQSLLSNGSQGYLVAGDKSSNATVVDPVMWVKYIDKKGATVWEWKSSPVTSVCDAIFNEDNEAVLIAKSDNVKTPFQIIKLQTAAPQLTAVAKASVHTVKTPLENSIADAYDVTGRKISASNVKALSRGVYVYRTIQSQNRLMQVVIRR